MSDPEYDHILVEMIYLAGLMVANKWGEWR